MKRILIAAILLVFIGCKENETGTIVYTKDSLMDVHIKKVDSDGLHIAYRPSVRMDSAIFYFNKEVESSQKRNEYEIKYLRTGNEKYRRLGNKYVDSVKYYYNLLKQLGQ